MKNWKTSYTAVHPGLISDQTQPFHFWYCYVSSLLAKTGTDYQMKQHCDEKSEHTTVRFKCPLQWLECLKPLIQFSLKINTIKMEHYQVALNYFFL